MAEHQVTAALQQEQWSDRVFVEYQRRNRFAPYMGSSVMSIIRRVEEYKTNYGDKITLPFFDQLNGNGASGNNTLDGNEEAMVDNGHQITLDWRRNAVKFSKREQNKTQIELDDIARELLTNWLMENTRGGNNSSAEYVGVIDALTAMTGSVPYADASTAQRDAFALNNADRILFGAAVGNYSATMATGLGTVDNTTDKLDAGKVTLAKRIAKTANPRITPYRTEIDEEWYVMFVGSLAFRDLKTDTVIQQANREAWTRAAGTSNPIFTDGDLIYDGVIIREIEEIPVIAGAGDSGIDVAQSFLCGAGAVGMAIGQRPRRTQSDNTDYGFRRGIGIEELVGIEKLFRGNKQNGVVTVFSAGVADS